jgi:hypothetical protein
MMHPIKLRITTLALTTGLPSTSTFKFDCTWLEARLANPNVSSFYQILYECGFEESHGLTMHVCKELCHCEGNKAVCKELDFCTAKKVTSQCTGVEQRAENGRDVEGGYVCIPA